MREALKLALEALNHYEKAGLATVKTIDAITAINKALAQLEQEPVAWSYWQSCLNDDGTQTAPWVHRLSKFKPDESIINKDVTPLYTTPPQRKPLTDEELDLMCEKALFCRISFQQFARSIEAAHGIKE